MIFPVIHDNRAGRSEEAFYSLKRQEVSLKTIIHLDWEEDEVLEARAGAIGVVDARGPSQLRLFPGVN